MALIKVSFDAGDVPAWIAKVKKKLVNPKHALGAIGMALASSTQKRIAQGEFKPNAPLTAKMKKGSNPLRDKGLLMNSITHDVGENYVVVGSGLRYARIHQHGGEIQAKRAKKLAIPAYHMSQKRLSPREYLNRLKAQGWHIWTTENAIMGRRGKGKAVVLYVRKKKVKIPQRQYLTIDEKDWAMIKRVLKTEILLQRG